MDPVFLRNFVSPSLGQRMDWGQVGGQLGFSRGSVGVGWGYLTALPSKVQGLYFLPSFFSENQVNLRYFLRYDKIFPIIQ
jgi:hypothetical protein